MALLRLADPATLARHGRFALEQHGARRLGAAAAPVRALSCPLPKCGGPPFVPGRGLGVFECRCPDGSLWCGERSREEGGSGAAASDLIVSCDADGGKSLVAMGGGHAADGFVLRVAVGIIHPATVLTAGGYPLPIAPGRLVLLHLGAPLLVPHDELRDLGLGMGS
eukprot:gene28643-36070_t